MPTRHTVPTPPATPAATRIVGRRGRELLHAEQPANRIQRGGDVGVRVGVYPPAMAGVSTMVTFIPS
jgi:hypothetical protein